MKSLFALILGIAIGAGVFWYLQTNSENHRLNDAGDKIGNAAKTATDAIQDKLRSFKLDGADIKDELARTGRVMREKAAKAGQTISDATVDARVTAAIKTRLLRNPDLSVWDISVNTTDGVVTLSGSVSSPELIGKAMLVAMDTDGVRQVISTLQVKLDSRR